MARRILQAVLSLGLAFPAACAGDGSSSNPEGTGGFGGASASGGLPGATGGTVAGTGALPGTGGVLAGTGGVLAGTGGVTGGTSSGGTAGGGSGGAAGGSGSGGASGASTGGTTAGGSGGAEADSGTLPPPPKPACLSDDRQIVLIGDSYINWVSHTFPTDINAASGMSIENFAIGGTSMGSGGIGLIPPQFDTAHGTHPDIRAVIMDGGGNDVLVPDTVQFPQGGQCKMLGAQSPSIPDCQKIVDKALAAGEALFIHMAEQGVKDAVFFFYPHVPLNTAVGGTDPNGMLDYALPKIKAACDGAYEKSVAVNPDKPIRCHFVDMVPVFAGHPEYFAPTDIHPNSTGSKAMAAAIWDKMKADCVGQPASSGCCAP